MFAKIFSIALLLAAFALPVSAVENTDVQTNEVLLASTISNAAAYDTIVSTATATVLLAYTTDRFGSEYTLVWDAITGTGSDSVNLRVQVTALNASSASLYTTEVDTIANALGGATNLGLGSTIVGSKYTVKLIGTALNGTQVILNRMYLYKRKPVSTTYSR